MAYYKTPGVYVEEIPSLPPSVATVSTAIPAFIGYTSRDGINVVKIRSMLEYIEQFGGVIQTEGLEVTLTAGGNGIERIKTPALKNLPLMYHALELYFKNGGGPCYVVSIGDAHAVDTLNIGDFDAGFNALEKEDEPTLILLVDAVRLPSDQYNAVCQTALLHCEDLKDRFCIFDVLNYDEDNQLLRPTMAVEAFRNGIGINSLKYGAAYYPYLKTTLTYPYTDDSVTLTNFIDVIGEYQTDPDGLRIIYVGANPTPDTHQVKIQPSTEIQFGVTASGNAKTLTISLPDSAQMPNAILEAWKDFAEKDEFDLVIAGSGRIAVSASIGTQNLVYVDTAGATLAALKYDRTALYNQIKTALDKQRIIMPPSPAIAGIYAFVDNTIGVWKAPANVSLASVIEPIVKLSSADQENFNIDANAGKSVNVIRTFTGKGILVWGARTLMGNDNEWRYINVRRLFNFVEESVQKSTHFAVFESNTAITWLKVRAMIESFLEDLWQAGGLAGETKEQAFFVNVGLGTTMTEQDVLEGFMKVEIGMAAVRPAEFIILKFSHKLQEG